MGGDVKGLLLLGLGVGVGALLLAGTSISNAAPAPAPTPSKPPTGGGGGVVGGDNENPPAQAFVPPIPDGWKYMSQDQVTPDMTAWAVSILHDQADYPMFSTATRTFDGQDVLARVEWHVPDFLSNKVHRGVSLFVPT